MTVDGKRIASIGASMPELELSDGIDLEQDLNDEYFRRLCSLGRSQRAEDGQYLYYQGDRATHIYLLHSGLIKSTQTDKNGHESLLKIHHPGSLIGLSALRPSAVRDANGVVISKAEVIWFGRDKFFDLMRADGELGILLIQILLKRQQQLHARVTEVTGHRVDQRLARVLLQLNAEVRTRVQDSETVKMPVTHEDLATLVLSRRQYVTAILRTFVADGLITNKRRCISVIDPVGLREIANGSVNHAEKH